MPIGTTAGLARADLIDRVRLIRSENIGPITYHRLVARYGSATAALAALPDLARRGGRSRALKIASTAAARRELDGLERVGADLLARDRPGYPDALATQ